MYNRQMTLEEAIDILYSGKKDEDQNPSYLKALRTITQAMKKDPELEIALKGKKIPLKHLGASLVEAGKLGIENSSRMNNDRTVTRKIIADRIKQIRQINKMTQEDISDAIDWNVLTYRGYENCKSDVPIVILIRLADYYEVSMDYLTGRAASPYEISAYKGNLEQRLAKLEKTIQKMQGNDK